MVVRWALVSAALALVALTPTVSAVTDQASLLDRSAQVGSEAYFEALPTLRPLHSLLQARLHAALDASELTEAEYLLGLLEQHFSLWKETNALLDQRAGEEHAQQVLALAMETQTLHASAVQAQIAVQQRALLVLGVEALMLDILSPASEEYSRVIDSTLDQMTYLKAAIASVPTGKAEVADLQDRLATLQATYDHDAATLARLKEEAEGQILAPVPAGLAVLAVFSNDMDLQSDLTRAMRRMAGHGDEAAVLAVGPTGDAWRERVSAERQVVQGQLSFLGIATAVAAAALGRQTLAWSRAEEASQMGQALTHGGQQ